MVKRMVVHDTRVVGGVILPGFAQNTYEPDGSTAIAHAIGWVQRYAQSQGGLDQLVILCHGIMADLNATQQTCTGVPVGGFGLQLCQEGLGASNVSQFSPWSGLIASIIVYACAAADTGPGNEGTAWDGGFLMMSLAHFSGAQVIASGSIQHASWENNQWVWDFSNWEGPIWRFDPTTNTQVPLASGGMSLDLDQFS
jgi:hypothetical protein